MGMHRDRYRESLFSIVPIPVPVPYSVYQPLDWYPFHAEALDPGPAANFDADLLLWLRCAWWNVLQDHHVVFIVVKHSALHLLLQRLQIAATIIHSSELFSLHYWFIDTTQELDQNR